MSLKQSVCIPIIPYHDIGLDALLKQIADIGYPAIEIWVRDEGFDTLCHAAVRHGLRVISMIGHASLPDGLNNPENHARIEDELKQSIDIAVDKGMKGLICFSGNRIEGMTDQEAIAHTVTGLRRVAPYAEAHGINMNLELLNSKRDHVGYQCDHTAWGLEVVRQVNSPQVKLLYDIYHMQIMEGDVIRTLLDHLPHIGHIHTAGNPGRNDLDDDQELNYRGICRALNQAGYDGYIGHEFRPKSHVAAALRQAFDVCDV